MQKEDEEKEKGVEEEDKEEEKEEEVEEEDKKEEKEEDKKEEKEEDKKEEKEEEEEDKKEEDKKEEKEEHHEDDFFLYIAYSDESVEAEEQGAGAGHGSRPCRAAWVAVFVKYNTAIALPSPAAVETLFSQGADIIKAKRGSI
ncbi:hypothetical protein GWK47_046689 [Chionoecetes opilio]|uniref:HAT C-terminal dimerisation domain-containing protein n=1 Tax=Chionoecetes opilio TaxID=41210 RepID=A0A8J4Y724_CHIOP|nr:hypothetical protein GWK47_046689 [Chionoecetes opilio]